MRDDLFSLLEDQIRAVVAEPAAAHSRAQRFPWLKRGRRLSPLVAALLLAGGAAVAGDRLLPIGSEVPVKQQAGGHEPKRLGPRVVVATGRVPVYGRWQMFASPSSAGPCQAIQFLDDAAAGGGIAEGCGDPRPVTASAVLPVPGGDKPQETVVYGRVPERTARVIATLPGLDRKSVKAVDGPRSVSGNWYLVAFAGIPRAGTARIVAVDEDGRQVGRTTRMSVSLHPTYPSPVARLAGPRRLAVTPSGHALVPLTCRRSAGHRGKCIGTVVIRVGNHLPRCEGGRRLRCGWQYFRLSPGTTRRVIRVRVGSQVLRDVRRSGGMAARLRVAGRSVDAQLVAS